MNIISLDCLPIGNYCKVIDLKCSGNVRRRLLDLGIVSGTKICAVLKSPSGDPTAFEIRGSLIALRKEDAKLINVSV